jgi:D-xylose 1-dehydrogenase (NADP+, D-xylono-1,5-lactone-forming)
MNKLRWGILGTARVARHILNGLRLSSRGEVYAVASRDPDSAQAYAAEKDIPHYYGSYEALLADPAVDIIYNPLPNALHAAWTIKALEAGKHVLCEKPLATSLADVDAMFAAAHQHRRALAEAFMYRHHPKILKTKALLESGAIGKVRLLRTCFSFTLDRPNDVRWNPSLHGGALWDVGCYAVSLARYLFGAPERVTGWQSLAPSGVDHTFMGTMFFPGDRAAQFDCSFRLQYYNRAEIIGTDGILILTRPFQPDEADAALILRCGDQEETIQLDNPPRYGLEIEDMHDAVLSGNLEPRITPAETRGTVETILALYRAAAADSTGNLLPVD